MANSSPPRRATKSVARPQAREAGRHRFEQFVADHVAERIVDALEFVDVDIEHRQLPVRCDVGQFALEPVVEQSAVRQIGQRVVVGEVGDTLFGPPALGDVFMGRHPAAVRQRLVDDLDRTSVRRRDHHGVALGDVAQHRIDIMIDVADERSGCLAMGNDVVKTAARLHDVGRQAVHFEIAMVADDQPLRRIEQQQPLRHVVDRGVEALLLDRQPLLRLAVLLGKLAHDEKQQHGNREHRQAGHHDQHGDLLAPVGQRCRRRRRRDDHDRKIRKRPGRNQPVLAIHRAGEAGRALRQLEYLPLRGRAGLEIFPDHIGHLRITGEQRAVAMVHGDRGAVAQRQRCEEFLEIGRLDSTSDDAEEFALRPRDLARDHRGPDAGDAAVDRLDQHFRRVGIELERLEVVAIRGVDRRHGPYGRCVDQGAVGVEDVEAADIGQCVDLGFQHQVDVLGGHPAPVILRSRDAVGSHERDQVLLNDLEVGELLVEMAGQQQHGVFQFALAVAQRALAEIAGHHGRADRDGGDQEDAAQDQPADRAAAEDGQDPQWTEAGRTHLNAIAARNGTSGSEIRSTSGP